VLAVGIGGKAGYSGRRALPYLKRIARSGDRRGRCPAAHRAARPRRCHPEARGSLTKVFSCAGCRTCERPTRPTVGSGVSPNRAAISARNAGRLIYPSGGLGRSRELSIVCPVMRPRPHNASIPAFVSSPGVLCFAQVVPGSPSTGWLQPASGRTTGSDRRVRLAAHYGLYEPGSLRRTLGTRRPSLGPPGGGCPPNCQGWAAHPLSFDPGSRTVLSVQKTWSDGCVSTEAGGPRPTRGALAPLVACAATCLAADVVPDRPSRAAPTTPGGCFHP
jgi:hypothetical protein